MLECMAETKGWIVFANTKEDWKDQINHLFYRNNWLFTATEYKTIYKTFYQSKGREIHTKRFIIVYS